jgi:phosphate:Na+ symporter
MRRRNTMARETLVETSRNLEEQIISMCDSTKEMLKITMEGFRRHDKERLNQAEKLGREIHQREKELTQLIMSKLSQRGETLEEVEALGFLPAHIERIGDNIELLIRCTRKIIDDGTCFSERAIKEINGLFDKTIELLECVRDALKTKNKVLFRYVKEERKKFQDLVSEYSLAHQERLIEGTCMSKASSVYLAIIDYLSEIDRHIGQMANKILA